MSKGGVKILLSIGTNLGDRLFSIKNSINLLKETSYLYDVKISSVYESEPIGVPNQPWFLNLCVSGFTNQSAEELLFLAKSIEYLSGRKKRKIWHERELDIDIILYGSEIIRTEKFCVPHKLFTERKFVLLPSSEIVGDMIDPISHLKIIDLLSKCRDDSVVKLYHE